MQDAWSKIPILAGVTEEGLAILMERVQTRRYSDGEVVIREGEPGNRVFLLGSGQVSVVKHQGSSHPVQLALLQAGDFFGEMCILETLPRAATVVATTDCTLHSLSSMDFYHLFQIRPDQYGTLILNIARDLSRRLRKLDNTFAASP